MKYYISNVADDEWMFILKWVKTKAHYFVTAKQEKKVKNGNDGKKITSIDIMSNYLLAQYKSEMRWHSKQKFVTVYNKYILNNEIWTSIFAKPSLESWTEPEVEDPSFYTVDEHPIIETISHESMVYAFLNNDEYQYFKNNGVEIRYSSESDFI